MRILGPNCFGIYCPESGLTILLVKTFPERLDRWVFFPRAAAYAPISARLPKAWESGSVRWSVMERVRCGRL